MLLHNASSRAVMHNPVPNVLDNFHANTFLDDQSIIATKYINPLFMGIYVISAHHTSLEASIILSFSK